MTTSFALCRTSDRQVERIGGLCHKKVSKRRTQVYAAALLVVASAFPAHAESDDHRSISSAGTVHVASVPGDRKLTSVTNRHRYHAAVSDQELEEAVAHYARENRLSPALLMAIMKAESGFNPLAISKAGAVGLMQLIPETAIRHGVKNMYDTRDNIAGGARHIRYLLNRFHGNVPFALAAYNAGEGKVDRYRQIPPYKETRAYVKKVIGFYHGYQTGMRANRIEYRASLMPMR
jgi:soluble lytic murein transglycosylase-like protein